MDLDHDTLVAFSKSWGLFYLIAFAHRRLHLHVLAIQPETVRSRPRHSILDRDDKPWQ